MELSSLFLAGKGSALTSFFSTAFLVVFLPFCLVVYSLMPRRGKKYFLLAADCAFFWLISGKLLVYLLLTALSMHYFGLWLDKIQSETKLLLAQTEKAERKTVRKRQQAVQHRILLLAVILHIGVLFALKYSGFAATNVNTLLAHLHIPVQLAIPKYVMPIGISFFTLQALSYIVDVQRGVTKADTNLLRLTLFISFFPQIVEGPICRYDQTAQQLWDAKPITYENLTLGLQRIAYGMMKKIIIADRLNPLVRNVFNNYTDFDGGVIALLGLSFKPETDDIRESPAVEIASALLADGRYTVRMYDPKAMENARRQLGGQANAVWCASAREAMRDADAVVIATEWSEFASMDLAALGSSLKQSVLFDLRNVYRKSEAEAAGLEYYGTGV